MSKRRYKFNVINIDELVAAFPQAVTEKIIPEHREFKPNYTIIAKLLDCGITVPGIVVDGHFEEVDDKPAFLGGKPVRAALAD